MYCDFTAETRREDPQSRFVILPIFLSPLLDPVEKKRKALFHSHVETGYPRQVLQRLTLIPHRECNGLR